VNIFKINLMFRKVLQTLALVPFEKFEFHFIEADDMITRSPREYRPLAGALDAATI
jgi:hypothetical protein